MTLIDPVTLAVGAFALALGGVLKGATGAGAPVIAIPILVLLEDVAFAVAIFSIPNLLSNSWQSWAYRASQLSRGFVARFAISGGLGAGVGSLILAWLSPDLLMILVSLVVFAYIWFRLSRPDWVLGRSAADRIVVPVGLVAGTLQGSGGISAPVSVTFLNAMRLERAEFIATIAVFFLGMAVIQIPTLAALGILTRDLAILSAFGALPLFGAMPLGAALAKRFSPDTFDRVILVLLFLIACRLLYGALG